MTTNVIDHRNKLIASDSRWSFTRADFPHLVFFIDDTGFNKIYARSAFSTICAGDALLVQGWMTWIAAPMPGELPPPTARIDPLSGQKVDLVASIVDHRTGEVRSWGKYDVFGSDAMFCGSGSDYARECYSRNFDGKRAIESAGQQDLFTGGKTLFVEHAGPHNLTGQSTLERAKLEFSRRGKVMDRRTKNVMTLDEFSKQAGAIKPDLTANFSLSAPTGNQAREWTDAERREAASFARTLAARELAVESSND